MLSFLLKRPVAVLMTYLAALLFSGLAFWYLPISLLPDIDVPQILIKISAPQKSPDEIEQQILRPIRENLLTLKYLKNLNSRAGSESGQVSLDFEYGTTMELAYLETNEKIDRLLGSLPRDLERPQVIRINTSDIPVARLQVIPLRESDLPVISELSKKVLRKRLETLPGVSLVDVSGTQEPVIMIEPYANTLEALGIRPADIRQSILDNNRELGAISVRQGQYRYYVRIRSQLRKSEDLRRLSIATNQGNTIPLKQLARVKDTIQSATGYHLFRGQAGLVINIHKQSQAQVTDLMPQLYQTLEQFREDYPQLQFQLTQDQSLLLKIGIDGLKNSLIGGGLFAFLVLFFFMGSVRVPVLIGISLPTSLLLSFCIFYLADLSLNVISLSGLILGLGMLIDNAIVVLENISRSRELGLSLREASHRGTREVMAPLISSVLTTLSVFLPLIFLSGLAGALFYDQALSVAAVLSTSLLVAFTLLPLLYLLFFQKVKKLPPSDRAVFRRVMQAYKYLYSRVFRFRRFFLLVFILVLPFPWLLYQFLSVEGLPQLEKNESLLEIDWNEAIDLMENRRRVEQLRVYFQDSFRSSEVDIGQQDFLLSPGDQGLSEARLYFEFEQAGQRSKTEAEIRAYLQKNFPRSVFQINAAPNAFDQLFRSDQPRLEARWRNERTDLTLSPGLLQEILDSLRQMHPNWGLYRDLGSQLETSIRFKLDYEKLRFYKIQANQVIQQLEYLSGNKVVDELKNIDESLPVQMGLPVQDLSQALQKLKVLNSRGESYPLSYFITRTYAESYRYLTADKGGIYHGVESQEFFPLEPWRVGIRKLARQKQIRVDEAGKYFEDQQQIQELRYVLLVAVGLLYFILAIQFESFLQPLIVLLTLSPGLSGSMLFLKMGAESLNVMSAIGLVVMLGIMVNDAILKIDTINRLRKTEGLEKALYEAGAIRLKPILMTSLTTILALCPVLFSSGLGGDLQRPLVLAVMGGLILGTFTALYVVPLLYYYLDQLRGLFRK